MTEVPIPFKPTYIMRTHFIVENELSNIINNINNILNSIEEVTYNYDLKLYKWTITIYKNTQICNVEINLFKEYKITRCYNFPELRDKDEDEMSNNKEIIIECNKLNGDAFLFHNLYNKLGNYFKPDEFPLKELNNFNPPPLPEGLVPEITEKEACNAIEPIVNLAKDESEYNRKMAAQVLCELTKEADIYKYMVQCGCVEVLLELINTSNKEIKLFCYDALNELIYKLNIKDIIKNSNRINLIMEDQNNESELYSKYAKQIIAEINYIVVPCYNKDVYIDLLHPPVRYDANYWKPYILINFVNNVLKSIEGISHPVYDDVNITWTIGLNKLELYYDNTNDEYLINFVKCEENSDEFDLIYSYFSRN